MNGDGLCSGVLRLRRGRPGWATPVLLFLAVLLAAGLAFNLGNLDPEGETLPAGPTAGSSPRSVLGLNGATIDALFVVVAGLLVAGVLYSLTLLRHRVKRETKPRSIWQILSSVLGLLLVVAVLLAWPRITRLGQSVNHTTDSASTAADGQNVTGWAATVVSTPFGIFLLILVLGTIIATTYLLRRGVDGFAAGPGVHPSVLLERYEATEAVRAAIVELEIGADVRIAILACFQRFCLLLGARGILDQEALTPRELEQFAVDRLHVSREASFTLTSLFEEARYSEHPLGEADRARAIDSLAGIRSALEA